MRSLKTVWIICFFVGVASSVASADIVIHPGSKIYIDNPGETVECEEDQPPFRRYCKCVEKEFTNSVDLIVILDSEGNYDTLSANGSINACEISMRRNPACD